QILEGIIGTLLQETDFYATNISNTQVLEVMQLAARASQHLQHTEIPAADRQFLPPLQTMDALASGFLIASAAVLGAQYTYHLTHFGGQSDRSSD
ncbi:MAG: hypothetical protein EZS28_056528, partial [Streblomastix strix]